MLIEEISKLDRTIIRNLYCNSDKFNPFYFIIQNKVKMETLKIKKKGKFLSGDLHTHTIYSDGMNNIDSLVLEAKKRGLDVIAVTDHELTKININMKRKLYSKHFSSCKKCAFEYAITVIPGLELASTEGHILALFATYEVPKEVSKIINNLSPEETVEHIHEAGGVAIAAHLYRKTGLRNKVLKIRQKIDGIELNSPYMWDKLDISENLGVAEIAGSDTHSRIGVGSAFTLFPYENYSLTIRDRKLELLIEFIRKKKTKAHFISSSDLLRNLDKTRWLSIFYAIKNTIGFFNDEHRVLSRKIERILL